MSDKGDYENANESRQEKKYGNDVKNFTVKMTGGVTENGLNYERSCTDILMLILFVAAIGAMGYLTHLGNTNGDVDRLIAPMDGENRICGHDDAKDFKYLYISNLQSVSISAIFDSAVCVKECPEEAKAPIDCLITENVKDCGSVTTYKTSNTFNYCLAKPSDLPEEFKKGFTVLVDQLKNSGIGSYFHDMYLSSRAMYLSLAMGCVYCIVYMYLMSIFAEQIAWVCVILVQIGLFAGAAFCWLKRTSYGKNLAEAEANQSSLAKENQKAGQDSIDSIKSMMTLTLILTVVFGLLAVLFLLMICCGYQSLKLAIDVIDASADFLRETKRILFVPLLYFFLSMVFLIIWAACTANVISMNKIEADPLIPQAKKLTWTSNVWYMSLYMLFMALWVTAWLSYTSQFITIVTACTYYFNSGPETEASADVATGFKFAYLYHMGSIAFGALIIAIVRFIRIVFVYICEKASEASGENPVVKGVAACGNCVLACIEKICDYINVNAFSFMAVTGQSFCSSAWYAFLLNMKHLLKFSFANLIAKVFIFIGKLAITVGNCYSLFALMKFVFKDTEEVGSLFGPIVAIGVTTYVTASIFLGIFDTIVQALLICLAIDMDMNDDEPKFGPPTFHDNMSKIKEGKSKRVAGETDPANELA